MWVGNFCHKLVGFSCTSCSKTCTSYVAKAVADWLVLVVQIRNVQEITLQVAVLVVPLQRVLLGVL